MESNKYNIPQETWKRLGENQQTFNQVYEKVIGKKEEFLRGITSDQRSEFQPVLDKMITSVVVTAVEELHHA